MGSYDRKVRKAFFSFITTAAIRLLSRSTVQSTIRGQVRKIFTGSREKPFREIPDTEHTALEILKLLDNRTLDRPCIGIDGIPGSGKSTLARSLSAKLKIGYRTLYSKELVKKINYERGMIYENMRLFRTQDIDNFDVIIYIDLSVEEAKSRVIERDRNGSLVDYLNFEKLKHIGDITFRNAAAETHRVGNKPVYLKIRPEQGFRLNENVDRLFVNSSAHIDNLDLEQKLFLLCFGKAGHGLWPYANLSEYREDFAEGIRAAINEIT